MTGIYNRPQLATLITRLEEPPRRIQVLFGPRQVGKTTLIRQALERLKSPNIYSTADEPGLKGPAWISSEWERARQLVRASDGGTIFVLDEIQKLPNWSESVKRLWDEDTHAKRPLKVVLLGSSPLLLQAGLTESLAGRFEVIPVLHWSYSEMQEAFGWSLEQYLYFFRTAGTPPSSRTISMGIRPFCPPPRNTVLNRLNEIVSSGAISSSRRPAPTCSTPPWALPSRFSTGQPRERNWTSCFAGEGTSWVSRSRVDGPGGMPLQDFLDTPAPALFPGP